MLRSPPKVTLTEPLVPYTTHFRSVKVKVLDGCVARKRIALTRRRDDAPGEGRSGEGKPRDERGANRRGSGERGPRRDTRPPKPASPPPDNALAAAFAKDRKSTRLNSSH